MWILESLNYSAWKQSIHTCQFFPWASLNSLHLAHFSLDISYPCIYWMAIELFGYGNGGDWHFVIQTWKFGTHFGKPCKVSGVWWPVLEKGRLTSVTWWNSHFLWTLWNRPHHELTSTVKVQRPLCEISVREVLCVCQVAFGKVQWPFLLCLCETRFFAVFWISVFKIVTSLHFETKSLSCQFPRESLKLSELTFWDCAPVRLC